MSTHDPSMSVTESLFFLVLCTYGAVLVAENFMVFVLNMKSPLASHLRTSSLSGAHDWCSYSVSYS